MALYLVRCVRYEARPPALARSCVDLGEEATPPTASLSLHPFFDSSAAFLDRRIRTRSHNRRNGSQTRGAGLGGRRSGRGSRTRIDYATSTTRTHCAQPSLTAAPRSRRMHIARRVPTSFQHMYMCMYMCMHNMYMWLFDALFAEHGGRFRSRGPTPSASLWALGSGAPTPSLVCGGFARERLF